MLYAIILPEIGGERDEKPVLVNEVMSDEVGLPNATVQHAYQSDGKPI